MLRIVCLIVLLPTALFGCGWFNKDFTKENERVALPLSVQVELDPSVTQAGLEFGDPCRQRRTLPMGEAYAAQLAKQMRLTYEQVQVVPPPAPGGEGIDGVVRIELGFQELTLFITRQDKRAYETKLALGGTATYTDAAGATLFTKRLRVELDGDVETDGTSCEVKGLDVLATQAMAKLAVGFKRSMAESMRIRKAAAGRKPGSRPVLASTPMPPATPTPQPPAPASGPSGPAGPLGATSPVKPEVPAAPANAPVPSPAAPAGSPPVPVPSPTPVQPPAPATPPPASDNASPSLSFQALLRDENGDNILASGELLTVEVEVINHGAETARDVTLVFSGNPAFMAAFPDPVTVGDLKPGESRRIKTGGKLGEVDTAGQAELVVSLKAAAPGAARIPRKKFIAFVRPMEGEDIEVLSVDVDQTPKRSKGYEQGKTAAVVIGVGSFRDPEVSTLRFASHDAEVMARYLQTVGGISTRRLKVLTDERALKADIAEAVEDWLPQQVDEGGTVLVYFSGRAMVDPGTGSILLFPHEGAVGSAIKLYSLRRLQTALAKANAANAVLILDVTLTASANPARNGAKAPVWTPSPAVAQSGRLVQLTGTMGLQHANEYRKGRHGLFTYWLLKGMGGEADEDKNGIIAIGELFEYAQTHVKEVALEEFGSEQEPVCIPGLDHEQKAWGLPLARVR